MTLFGDDPIETLKRVVERFYDKHMLEKGISNSLTRVLKGNHGHSYALSIDQNRSQSNSAESLFKLISTKQKGKKTSSLAD